MQFVSAVLQFTSIHTSPFQALLSNNEEDDDATIPILSPLYLGVSAVGLIIVLTSLVAAPIILCAVCKWRRRSKRMVISKPQSYHGRLAYGSYYEV